MKIVPYTKRGEVYELKEEFNLPIHQDGIMIMTDTVRVIIREKSGRDKSGLIIEIPNKKVKVQKCVNKKGMKVYYLTKRKSSTCIY